MSDLYNIPNDDGKYFRLNKFVEYQHKVPAIHPITIMKYFEETSLSKDDLVRIAYLQSITYCEITTIFLYEILKNNFYNKQFIQDFWNKNKSKLIFNSARKWVYNKDMFCRLINDFNSIFGLNPYEKIKRICKYDKFKNYSIIKKYLSYIKDCGRFAQDLFLEMMLKFYKNKLIDIELEEPLVLDWNKDANMTSGLFNIMYEDELANEFDKKNKVNKQQEIMLYNCLLGVQDKIKNTYPEQDFSLQSFMTKICSFRNLFKNQRYGGYHHDRQLENILKYKEVYPDYNFIWDKILSDRAILFDHKLLGELNNWKGIRKEMKKIWINKGLTGVEDI